MTFCVVMIGLVYGCCGDQISKESISLQEAIDSLERARFDFPEEAAKLWKRDDGLPVPDEPQFAARAARFLSEHPIPPAGERDLGLWDTPNTASRQGKCLAYLANGKKEARREVASLCVTQAMQMQWTFPMYAGHGPNRTFRTLTDVLSWAMASISPQAGTAAHIRLAHIIRATNRTRLPQSAMCSISGASSG